MGRDVGSEGVPVVYFYQRKSQKLKNFTFLYSYTPEVASMIPMATQPTATVVLPPAQPPPPPQPQPTVIMAPAPPAPSINMTQIGNSGNEVTGDCPKCKVSLSFP